MFLTGKYTLRLGRHDFNLTLKDMQDLVVFNVASGLSILTLQTCSIPGLT